LSLVQQWLRQGWGLVYKDIHNSQTTNLRANMEHSAVVDEKGQGVLIAGIIMFTSNLCGIRFIQDEADSERWLRIDNMYNFRMTQPQSHFFITRYDTVNSRFTIMITSERIFRDQLRIIPFNEDTVQQQMLGYQWLYAKRGSKIQRSTDDLLEEIVKLLSPKPLPPEEVPELAYDPQRRRLGV